MDVFGLHPVVVHGTAEQKRRWLPPIIEGRNKACFGVTEPNTGLNTPKLKTMAVRKGDRYVVNGQMVWISTAQVAHKILLLARTTPIEEVTSPARGLSLFYTDFDRTKIEVREIEKLGRKLRIESVKYVFETPAFLADPVLDRDFEVIDEQLVRVHRPVSPKPWCLALVLRPSPGA